MPLDPEHLTPAASVNRVRIVDLPGLHLPDNVRDKTALDLCSQAALARQIREIAPRLGIPGTLDDAELPPALAACLSSADPDARSVAEAVCADYGRNLGLVIATLKRGDGVNRRAREEWDESYWRHWAGVRRLWLAGGLVSGALGVLVREHVTRALLEAGVRDCEVRVFAKPSVLPLVGAARGVIADARAVLVTDFGQTKLKSAVAVYDTGRLQRIDVLPEMPSVVSAPNVAEAMALRLAGLYRAEEAKANRLAPEIAVCIASYVRDNHPYNYTRTQFAVLHRDTDNLGDWLTARLSDLVGCELRVRLLHDGSAAANAFAGEPNTAVIMMGTALGVGFPSLVRPASALAPDFEIKDADS
ncbi:MAG TPA: hypothetical protein VJB57_07025 [Dehalococcoidia bacterium]|nr:hypothetical protein [Dehalococcoidia bacterium]